MQYLVLTNPKNPSGERLTFEEIKQAIESALIDKHTQIWEEEKAKWVEIQHHSSTQSLFAQSLWDAWEEAEEAEFASIDTPTEQPADTTSESKDSFVYEVPPKESPTMDILPDPFTSGSSLADTAEPPQPLEATQNIEKASPYEDLPMIDDNLLISLEEVAPQKITLHQPALQKPYKKKVSVQKPAPPRDFDISETNFSLTRVLIPILLGGCLIWLTKGYIQSEAMSSYKPPPKPSIA